MVFDQKVFDITQKAPIETHKNDIFLPSLIYSLLRREHKKQQKMFFMNPADLKIRDKSEWKEIEYIETSYFPVVALICVDFICFRKQHKTSIVDILE